VGDLVYFAAALFGVVRLLRWAPFRWGIWIGGTGVLLVLAAKMFREVMHPRAIDLDVPAPTREKWWHLFGWGVALALASPTSVLWFAAVGAAGIAAFGADRSGLIPFASGFLAAGILWSAFLAAAATVLKRVGGASLARALALVSAVLFLFFAVTVFVRGWTQLRA